MEEAGIRISVGGFLCWLKKYAHQISLSRRGGMWFLNPEVTKGTVDGSENLHLVEVGSFSHYLRDLIWFYTSQVVQDIFYYPLCNLKQRFGSVVARVLGDVAPIGISVFCTNHTLFYRVSESHATKDPKFYILNWTPINPCMPLAAVFHVTRTLSICGDECSSNNVFHVTRMQNTVPNEKNARVVAVPLGGALLAAHAARDPEGIARDIIKSCLIWLLALKKLHCAFPFTFQVVLFRQILGRQQISTVV